MLELHASSQCHIDFKALWHKREGVIAIDESDRARSKRTKRIHHMHKQKHKELGELINDTFQLMPSDKRIVGKI